MFFVYNLLLTVASVVLLPYALIRGLRRGQPWRRLPERFGFLPRLLHQTAGDSIWLHAVSMGEVLSCVPLVHELRRRFPSTPLFVSSTTPTGQQAALDKFAGKVDGVFYVPLDYPSFVRRVLRQLQPRLVIVIETEIWPNLFHETKRTGAALLQVNARISEKSTNYRRFRFFFRHVLRCPDRILCQSALDRERFIAAGAPEETTTVNGNLKFDFAAGAAELPAEVAGFLDRLDPDPLLVAGSTREHEERPVIEAFRQVADAKSRALLVVAPRHPPRFDEVADLLASSGIPYLRRSELGRTASANLQLPGVLLLDSTGELASLYSVARVAFLGGSLNGWGGHNVLEGVLIGCPVVVGPHMQNFRDIVEVLSPQGLVQVDDVAELGPALLHLLENPEEARRLGERGRQVAESHRGATNAAATVCEQLFREHSVVPPRPALLRRILLSPLALLWGAAARVRLAAYRRGWLSRRKLSAFTVCVGNLTAGGAGKTPLVAWLVEHLSRAGHKPAVLTRGYGRSSSQDLVLRPGERVPGAECGDEAIVLQSHFERANLSVPIGIGANRHQVGLQLLAAGFPSAVDSTAAGEDAKSAPAGAAPDVLVLDDGFQHLALQRDADLVLVDVTNPFGGGMIPLGRRREPVSALSRAGAILLTRTEPDQSYEDLQQQLRRVNPQAPIFLSRARPVAVAGLAKQAEWPLAKLEGLRIAAFCGLGNPESFWRMLRHEGWNIIQRHVFDDHHRYSAEDLRRIAEGAAATRADLILTTEKDIANLVSRPDTALDAPGGPPHLAEVLAKLHWLKIETVVEQGDELLRWIEKAMEGRARQRGPGPQARAQGRG